MNKTMINIRLAVIACSITLCSGLSADEKVFHHEHVLGTSMELRVECADAETAESVEKCVLGTVDQLSAILSRHNHDSELNRWQRGELDDTKPSAVLSEVLDAAAWWRTRTNGAFHIRAQALWSLWSDAEKTQTLPDTDRRHKLVAELASSSDNDSTGLPISLDALAKGYILDAVCETVQDQFPNVGGFTVNIGGDLRRFGASPLPVSVTDPANPGEGGEPLMTLISEGPIAIATSGSYRRWFQIQDRKYSEVIDPRTGEPQSGTLSASVIAPTAMAADAAATAISVLGPAEGVPLMESLPGFECLIVTADHQLHASKGWPQSVTPSESQIVRSVPQTDAARVPASQNPGKATYHLATAKTKPGLHVEFKLNRPKGAPYRRPYVAVWLEDKDGFPVRTAVLWMQTEQPGPRWHRDLSRWYRNDRMRQVVEKKKLIGTISGATRGPGRYEAHFDGVDNSGAPLPPGKYTLCLETAREHGTYQIIRKSLELGDKPIEKQNLKHNVEISEASVIYLPWSADDKDAAQ